MDEGREKQLEEMLRIVSRAAVELGMDEAAAVSAAAAVGIDDPARPGDIAVRLLTRLLLVGKKAPAPTHTAPSVSGGTTLLLFYETDCPECEPAARAVRQLRHPGQGHARGVHRLDADGDTFSTPGAASLPWATKWRAAYGFYSNDRGLRHRATPTLVAVNPDGRVEGYFRTLKEYEQSAVGGKE